MCWQFSFTGFPEFFVVPAAGRYLIAAIGANGGPGISDLPGGLGAEIGGLFPLEAGDALIIFAGRAGQLGQGGSASYVLLHKGETLVPLVIAGGGGGGGSDLPGDAGSPQHFAPAAASYPEADGTLGHTRGGHGGRSYLADSVIPSPHTIQLRGANTTGANGNGLVRIIGAAALTQNQSF